MMFFLAIVFTVIVVVGFHELGHAFAARLFGVQIEKISIGFGKPLLSFQWRRATWILALWPLGGYVQMKNTRIAPVEPLDLPHCFDKKPIWMRCIILFAGSFVNIVLAWILLSSVAMIGKPVLLPVIGNVMPGTLAAQAGMKSGDRIIAIRNEHVNNWFDAAMGVIKSVGQKRVLFTLEVEGKTHIAALDLSHLAWDKKAPTFFSYLGFQPDLNKNNRIDEKPLGVLQSAFKAVCILGQWLLFVAVVVKQLALGLIPLSVLMGPLGFFSQVSTALSGGIVSFMGFLALLSFFVGVINLLPVPGLDGGSLLYTFIEKLFKKTISIRAELLLYRLAMIGFALLFVQLLLNDLQKALT